jgi:hypothetical protein
MLLGLLTAAPSKLEARAVPGSPFEEIHVTALRSEAPGRVCEAIWGPAGGRLEKGFRRRDVLRETPTERWTYEQISAPVVSDRDYVLHVTREASEGAGCLIRFETTTELGPGPQRGFVRIPLIRGSWDVSPTPEGTRVNYTIFSDPGGHVPAFLCRHGQRKSAEEWMARVLGRLDAKP